MKITNDSSEGQEILREFTVRHVLLNLNDLMSGLCGSPDVASRILDEDENKFYSISSKDEWEETARNANWVGDESTCVTRPSLDGGELVVDTWQEACEYDELDPVQTEALEFWAVSDWFGEKLANHGELVEDIAGLTVWGRSCSGQAICMDGVVSAIYNSVN